MAAPAESRIAEAAAEGAAANAAEEVPRREERRVLQVQLKILHEERRNPAEEQPQGPTVAEIDDRHRQDAARQFQPRHLSPRCSASRRRQGGELLLGHPFVLARLVAEERGPGGDPDQAGKTQYDEGAA